MMAMPLLRKVVFSAKFCKPPCHTIRHAHLEKHITVFGKELNFLEAGEGDKTLLLMPGALGSALTDFGPQIEQLPQLLPSHTLIAWDPPGCGKSKQSESDPHLNMFESQANCAIDLMQAIKRGNFSVLGWNTGGASAMIMAGRFPQFVDKLVIWGSSAYLSLSETKKLDELRGVESKKYVNSMGKALRTFYGEERFAKMWPSYLSSIEKVICEKNGNICKTECECIQAPTLILHGGNDPIISKDHVAFLLRHIKNAKFQEFPRGSHDIHLDNPTQFNKHVSKFLLESP